MKKTLLTFAIITTLCLYANISQAHIYDTSYVTSNDTNTITICHVSADDPSDTQTMEVPGSQLLIHLSHGDSVGVCNPIRTCGSPNTTNLPGTVIITTTGNLPKDPKTNTSGNPTGN